MLQSNTYSVAGSFYFIELPFFIVSTQLTLYFERLVSFPVSLFYVNNKLNY